MIQVSEEKFEDSCIDNVKLSFKYPTHIGKHHLIHSDVTLQQHPPFPANYSSLSPYPDHPPALLRGRPTVPARPSPPAAAPADCPGRTEGRCRWRDVSHRSPRDRVSQGRTAPEVGGFRAGVKTEIRRGTSKRNVKCWVIEVRRSVQWC